MLYIKIDTASKLQEMFIEMGRDSFSYEAYEALLGYYEETDEELDVIALDCGWREASVDDIIADYYDLRDDIGYEDDDYDEDMILDKVREYLDYRTYYIELSNGNFLFGEF